MDTPDFYLTSADSYGLDIPRRVWRIKGMTIGRRDDALLAKLDPPVKGGLGLKEPDITVVLLATRHQGASLFPVSEWPVYVHLAAPLVENVELRDRLELSEVRTIAWAELYRTEEDARRKRL